MASSIDKKSIKTSEKLLVADNEGQISSLVFPHKMQIGIPSKDYNSNLEVYGSVILKGEESVVASKNTSMFRGGGFIYANSSVMTGSLTFPENYNGLIMGPYVIGDTCTLTISSGSSLVVKGFEDF